MENGLGIDREFGSAELFPLSETSEPNVCQKVRPKFGRSSAEPNFRSITS